MTLLARLISKEEGFGIPGALPTRDNNPGDLRHSPHSSHTPDAPDAIGKIDSVADGWADLERQLQRYAERGLTLAQMVEAYAPDSENDSAAYLAFLCKGLNLSPETPVAEALKLA
jgi:selenocysteine lyase/cysteine desulfurase